MSSTPNTKLLLSNKTYENPLDNELIVSENTETNEEDSKNDRYTIAMLLVFYFFQGIPMGLLRSVPIILTSKKVTYAELGMFSFALWPGALRLFFAPLIDVLYFKKIGRRKSWIVPIQLSMGLIFLLSAEFINNIFLTSIKTTDIYLLTAIFGLISLLNSILDVALDAWAVELLSEKNLAWQATSNAVGFGSGSFIGNAFFILLSSSDFCNKYIRNFLNLPKKEIGIIDFRSFCYTYGVVIIISSLVILVFKRESSHATTKKIVKTNEIDGSLTITDILKLVWKLMKIPQMRKLIFILLTIRIGFASENVLRIKLLEEGVARETITIIGIMFSPFLFVLPFAIKKYVHSKKPLNLILNTYSLKLIFLSLYIFFIFLTPWMRQDSKFPFYYFGIYFVLNVVNIGITAIFFICTGSFFAQICDKSIGATFMTFLTLWLYIGLSILSTSSLYLTNLFTFKSCQTNKNLFFNNSISKNFKLYNNFTASLSNNLTFYTSNISRSDLITENRCSTRVLIEKCIKSGGYCQTDLDGFYLMAFIFLLSGFLWILFCKKILNEIQSLPKESWSISTKK